jgi:protocatechuate 3,4-dioxygenase, beta subunit
MNRDVLVPQRRLFLGTAALSTATALFTVKGLFAEELTKTPSQTEGPFYPDKLPLDTDNDLLIINDGITPGVGEITHLTGKVFDLKGNPVTNAVVEIWQCDHAGAYLHSRSDNGQKRDKHFQGFGRFTTGRSGEYYFRTIKPVPYPGRTPHIHFKVKKGGKDLLVTQMYIKGHPGNARDGLYNGVRDPKAKESITVAFDPIKDSKIGELAAKFDIVLGMTPEAK